VALAQLLPALGGVCFDTMSPGYNKLPRPSVPVSHNGPCKKRIAMGTRSHMCISISTLNKTPVCPFTYIIFFSKVRAYVEHLLEGTHSEFKKGGRNPYGPWDDITCFFPPHRPQTPA
jgi:hypothetical protein